MHRDDGKRFVVHADEKLTERPQTVLARVELFMPRMQELHSISQLMGRFLVVGMYTCFWPV